jgi:ABC-type phosphate/phosphonate transport system substrate-binding protein
LIASLPMYDLPDCRAANDRYWTLIRDGLRGRGVAAPDTITRGIPNFMEHWLRPDLVLSQTCGYPYRAVLDGKVTLIGTPDFGLDHCPPGHYQSVLVARADDRRADLTEFKDARFAYNEALSQSGWAAPQNHAASLGFQFKPALQTGGHALSALAVIVGRADIASIDAMTWRLLVRNYPAMSALKIIDRTEPTPCLPYIAALGASVAVVFNAVKAAIHALRPEDRETLGIRGIYHIPAVAYLAVLTPAAPDQFAHEN